MSPRQRTIALVRSDTGETPVSLLAARRDHLMEQGWDAHLLSADREPATSRIHGGRLRVDVAHFDSAQAAADPSSAGIRSLGTCVVTLATGDLYNADSRQPAEDRVLQGCRRAGLLHLHDAAAWERVDGLGCPAETPRAVVPPAADPRLLEIEPHEGRAEGPLRLLSVGALTWMAGYEHSLHAIRKLLDRGIDCSYRLIGAGPHLDFLLYSREQLGLIEEVEFVDEADDEERREVMRTPDVFVHSAVVPGVGQPLVDALAASLPVVATEGEDLIRDTLDRGAGVLVPRRDPGAIADAVAGLSEDREARLKMGRSARRIAREHFDAGAQLEAFERLYSEALPASEGSSRKSTPKV